MKYKARVKKVEKREKNGKTFYLVFLENKIGEWILMSYKKIPEGAQIAFDAEKNSKGNWILKDYEEIQEKQQHADDIRITATALVKSFVEAGLIKTKEEAIEYFKFFEGELKK